MRLLIADIDQQTGHLQDVTRRMEIVRLGQGVDRTGRFNPQALERALTVAAQYGQECAAAGVEALRFVATSATRDAADRDVFLDGVRGALGVEAEVVDGVEEAHLSFRGALSALATTLPDVAKQEGGIGFTSQPHTAQPSHQPNAPRSAQTGGIGHRSQTDDTPPTPLPGPYLCVDLGGGSTELVLGWTEPEFAFSMDVGCVRITERHLRSDPPSAAQVLAASADVDAVLDRAARYVPLGQTATLIGLAGSITTITAHALGLTRYQPELIDGAVLSVDQMLASCAELWQATTATRARMGFMHPGRVDVIGAGALVWSRVLLRIQAEVAAADRQLTQVVTSEHDILDGITLSAAESAKPWPAERTVHRFTGSGA
jgi:exopolyphosphatase/guanosine-5'-triphosphate,3'-diphosphate pyrophosphatase